MPKKISICFSETTNMQTFQSEKTNYDNQLETKKYFE